MNGIIGRPTRGYPTRHQASTLAAVTERSDAVHTFVEADYLYGAGSLVLRIEHVDRVSPVRHDGDLWYPVTGIEIGYNGVELGRRDALIRAQRLPP